MVRGLFGIQTIIKRFIKLSIRYRWYGVLVGLTAILILLFRIGMEPILPESLTLDTNFHNAQQKSKAQSIESKENESHTEIENQTNKILDNLKESSIVTILLVGVDNRPGENYISNTDTLIVANVNRQKNQIALLSVPRDTQVEIGNYGTNKINNAARIGGSYKETIRVLEDLLGQEIDGYVISDFSGFKRMIDTIGGITIQVEKDMVFDTGDKIDGVINLKKGLQHLNGTQALQYARFRNDALADISRTVRQQTVLKALASKVLQLKNIPKLPQIIPELYQSVYTNLSLLEMLSLTNSLLRLDNFNIVSQTLPGKFVIEHEVSYWKVNAQESKLVAENLFAQGKTSSMFSGLVKDSESEVPRKASTKMNQKHQSTVLPDTRDIKTEIIYSEDKNIIESQPNINKNVDSVAKQGVIFEVLEP